MTQHTIYVAFLHTNEAPLAIAGTEAGARAAADAAIRAQIDADDGEGKDADDRAFSGSESVSVESVTASAVVLRLLLGNGGALSFDFGGDLTDLGIA